MAGDLRDLQTALVPCIVGYAGIGRWLAADPATQREGNPYLPWIEMYAGEEYQEVARAGVEQLDRLMAQRGGEGRFASLARPLRQAPVDATDLLGHGAPRPRARRTRAEGRRV